MATFASLGFPLSSDVCRLYETTGGFQEGELDNLWELWTLERLIEDNKSGPEYLYFADWLIDSHRYALRYLSPKASAVFVDYGVPDEPLVQVADDTGDFLRKYVEDPEIVHSWQIA